MSPASDGQGPPVSSTGPRDGSGQGKGNHAGDSKGTGTKTGGGKGTCSK